MELFTFNKLRTEDVNTAEMVLVLCKIADFLGDILDGVLEPKRLEKFALNFTP